MIEYKLYTKELEKMEIADGFFQHWPNPPDKNGHRRILEKSYKSVVAIHENKIIGFVNIISDGVLSAYIPLLEVIPEYQKQGIGKKLMELAIDETKDFYMIDLSCSDDVVEFYEKLGMERANAMCFRNYKNQSGK